MGEVQSSPLIYGTLVSLMKNFDELTPNGQIRRYHKLAQQALQAYPIKAKKLRCISSRHNIIFRVDTEDNTFALKIGYPDIRNRLMVQSEMQWLDDLQIANIPTKLSYPIRTHDGELVVSTTFEGIPSERHTVLMTWLRGRLVSLAPAPKKLYQLGAAMANLHQFAENYQPSEPFMTFDAFRCDEWGGLSYLEDSHPFLSDDEKIIFRQAIEISEKALEKHRKQDGLRMIHADLHLKNSISYKGEVAVFDFDDCRWGHVLQDIAVMLTWFDQATDTGRALRESFLRGYQSIRTLAYTEQDLVLAEMHRRMVGLTFIMNYRPLGRRKVSEETKQWLEQYL